MSHWSYYEATTGVFTGQWCVGSEHAARMNLPAGCALLEGAYDPAIERVDVGTGAVVPYTPPKPPDDQWQTWALVGDRWQSTPTTAALWRDVRAQRDLLLAACDWVSIRAADLGEPVPTAWAAYRQTLRDITTQPDPAAIVWPVRPE